VVEEYFGAQTNITQNNITATFNWITFCNTIPSIFFFFLQYHAIVMPTDQSVLIIKQELPEKIVTYKKQAIRQ
jgi:hypothetical protein